MSLLCLQRILPIRGWWWHSFWWGAICSNPYPGNKRPSLRWEGRWARWRCWPALRSGRSLSPDGALPQRSQLKHKRIDWPIDPWEKWLILKIQCGAIVTQFFLPKSSQKTLVACMCRQGMGCESNPLVPWRFEWNFQANFSDSWLRYLLWNCLQMNVTGSYWW